MRELREIEGVWWLPDRPDDRQAGTLRASADDVALSLIGSFRDLFAGRGNVGDTYPVVLGVGDGKLVTLSNCFESQYTMSAPGIQKQRIFSHLAFIGAHLADHRITRVLLRTTYLPEWSEPPVLVPNLGGEEGTKAVDVRYVLPPDLEATVGSDRVHLAYGWSTSGQRFRSIRLDQTVSFDIHLAEATSFEDVQARYVFPLQNLLTLATDEPNAITDLQVWPAPESELAASQVPVVVVYPAIFKPGADQRDLHPQTPFFRLRDIAADFNGFMNRWFALSQRLSSVCNLFFSNRYAPPQFGETRFLIYCQAAEVFHRLTFGNHIEDSADHEERKSAVLAGAPAEHHLWLEGALAHSNDKRLRQRLRELVARVTPIVGDAIGDPQAFVQDVVATRNYFTHWDAISKEGAATGVGLLQLSQRLRLLLQLLLMLELGIDEDACRVMTRENRFVIGMRA